LLVEHPVLASGARIRHRAQTNLTASRGVVARALGLGDHRAAAIEIAERLALEPRALPGQTERTMNG
jgi:hypothetical protein